MYVLGNIFLKFCLKKAGAGILFRMVLIYKSHIECVCARVLRHLRYVLFLQPQGLMLKLKLQYFGHLMRRADSSERTLILEKIEGRRRA